jgi:hypothetical protein
MQSDKSVRVPDSGDAFSKTVPLSGDAFFAKANRALRKYGRIPVEVLMDPKVHDRDIRVYGALASLERNGHVNCGVRWIGSCCNFSRSEVSRSIHRLQSGGYIDVVHGKNGQRSGYRLTSIVFNSKDGKTEHVVHSGDNQQLTDDKKYQVVDSMLCSQCRLPRKRIGMSGICVVCVRRDNTERAVKEILTIDPHATKEEVYIRLKSRKAKEINRAMDRLMAETA